MLHYYYYLPLIKFLSSSSSLSFSFSFCFDSIYASRSYLRRCAEGLLMKPSLYLYMSRSLMS